MMVMVMMMMMVVVVDREFPLRYARGSQLRTNCEDGWDGEGRRGWGDKEGIYEGKCEEAAGTLNSFFVLERAVFTLETWWK